MSVSNNIKLAPGEKGLYSRDFRPNLVLFWLRSTMLVTNKRLLVKTPNTILGVIPLGFEERSMPIGAIAGITTSMQVKVGRLLGFGLLALVLVLFGFASVGDSAGSAFFLILLGLACAAIAANAILTALVLTNNGGGTTTASVSFLEQGALNQFRDKANEIIYSASAGGQSWDMAYEQNTEGFQNQLGAAGGPAQPQQYSAYQQPQFGQQPQQWNQNGGPTAW